MRERLLGARQRQGETAEGIKVKPGTQWLKPGLVGSVSDLRRGPGSSARPLLRAGCPRVLETQGSENIGSRGAPGARARRSPVAAATIAVNASAGALGVRPSSSICDARRAAETAPAGEARSRGHVEAGGAAERREHEAFDQQLSRDSCARPAPIAMRGTADLAPPGGSAGDRSRFARLAHPISRVSATTPPSNPTKRETPPLFVPPSARVRRGRQLERLGFAAGLEWVELPVNHFEAGRRRLRRDARLQPGDHRQPHHPSIREHLRPGEKPCLYARRLGDGRETASSPRKRLRPMKVLRGHANDQ